MSLGGYLRQLGLDRLLGKRDHDDSLDDPAYVVDEVTGVAEVGELGEAAPPRADRPASRFSSKSSGKSSSRSWSRSAPKSAPAAAIISETASSTVRALLGTAPPLGDFYFPPDLIGGTCPRIPGEEEDIVWHAAAEACDSERVHVVWQSFENRIWYLAVKSSDLASQSTSWCPFASLLPSLKDAQVPPVCYTYFGDEYAVLMIVTADGLQIFRGTGPIVRAKAERTARELGPAPIIVLDTDRIEQLAPVPWYSVSLYEDKARRLLATLSFCASILVTAMSFLVWLIASMAQVSSRHDMTEALDRTRNKSMQLVSEAEAMRSSPLREQLEKFMDVNDGLLALNGFLNIYEIKEKRVRWRAEVPPSATADRITAISGKNIEVTDHGVAIGNDAEIEYERTGGKK
jgi:hypothetical protein